MQNQNQNQQNQANQQQQAQAVQAAANQQGPNHLGLQVPYADGPGGSSGSAAAPAGLRASVPTHVQLQQIEQRIIQESQALGLEHQQVQTLRAMEAHLAYLRTLQQQQTGSQTQQRQIPPQMPAFLPQAWNHGMPVFPQMMPPQTPQAQTVHGSASRVLRRGDEGLPEGLVLPEGWTLTPLRPIGSAAGAVSGAIPQSDAVQMNGDIASSSHPQQTSTGHAGDGVPRDENGSPLFVPTVPDVAPDTNPAPLHPTQAATSSAPQTITQPSNLDSQPPASSEPTAQTEDTRHPWNSEGGWSFVDPPAEANGQDNVNSEQGHDQPNANGAPKSPEQQESSERSKGKQAEVEDAPDEGT
jgi:E3 ubiquitin-protein ligase synoviolin